MPRSVDPTLRTLLLPSSPCAHNVSPSQLGFSDLLGGCGPVVSVSAGVAPLAAVDSLPELPSLAEAQVRISFHCFVYPHSSERIVCMFCLRSYPFVFSLSLPLLPFHLQFSQVAFPRLLLHAPGRPGTGFLRSRQKLADPAMFAVTSGGSAAVWRLATIAPDVARGYCAPDTDGTVRDFACLSCSILMCCCL